jgi:hypothetical protein
VTLWLAVNRHLVHVIESMPAETLDHSCSIGGRAPITTAALIADYVSHLEHHLERIWHKD